MREVRVAAVPTGPIPEAFQNQCPLPLHPLTYRIQVRQAFLSNHIKCFG